MPRSGRDSVFFRTLLCRDWRRTLFPSEILHLYNPCFPQGDAPVRAIFHHHLFTREFSWHFLVRTLVRLVLVETSWSTDRSVIRVRARCPAAAGISLRRSPPFNTINDLFPPQRTNSLFPHFFLFSPPPSADGTADLFWHASFPPSTLQRSSFCPNASPHFRPGRFPFWGDFRRPSVILVSI